MAAKKRPARPRAGEGSAASSAAAGGNAADCPWDPASTPATAGDADREFHATHFTADPRGKVKPGAKPKGSSGRGRGR